MSETTYCPCWLRRGPGWTTGPLSSWLLIRGCNRFEYLWQDGENYKRPTKMSAPAYIEQLMTWVQSNIDNESVLPSKIGKKSKTPEEEKPRTAC